MESDSSNAVSPPLPFILLVEDDAAIRQTMVALLQHEGYVVHSVGNGQEALNFLEKKTYPCLVFLDLQMPVMDGWTFLEHLKQANQLAHIPVVIVSAVADRTSFTGVVAKVSKPFEVEAVLGLARQYCGSGKGQQGL